MQISSHVRSWHIDERGPLFSGFLVGARAFLYTRSEDLEVLAAKDDIFLADDLPVFSEYCRNEHSFLLPLSATGADD